MKLGSPGYIQKLALQPDGKLVLVGYFGYVNGVIRNGVARLNGDGSLDESFDPGIGIPPNTDGWIRELAILSDGKILLGGVFRFRSNDGVERRLIARLNSNGALDPTFRGDTEAPVQSIGFLSGGKLLVENSFWDNDDWVTGLSLLNENGSLSADFGPPGLSITGPRGTWLIDKMLRTPDQRIIVAGSLRRINGTAVNGIARLNSDLSIDRTFNDSSAASDGPNAGVEMPGTVRTIKVQRDGKLLIGGDFIRVNQTRRENIARLNRDGSTDISFNSSAAPENTVFAIALQDDGKLVIQGSGYPNGRNVLARLNPDGSKDANFHPVLKGTTWVEIYDIAIQDKKILFAGRFDTVGDTITGGLARLNEDGTLDRSFSRSTIGIRSMAMLRNRTVLVSGVIANSDEGLIRLDQDGNVDSSFATLILQGSFSTPVSTMSEYPDGRVLLAGDFTAINGVVRNRIARLNADGAVDGVFAPGVGPDIEVKALAFESAGGILIGGRFNRVSGIPRDCVARLHPDGTLDPTFDPGSGIDGTRERAVYALATDPDGTIVIGGHFQGYNGIPRNGIARILGGQSRSRLRLLRPSLSGSEFAVFALTEEGKNYVLEFKTSLTESVWKTISSFSGDGKEKRISDPTANVQQRFYRVRSE